MPRMGGSTAGSGGRTGKFGVKIRNSVEFGTSCESLQTQWQQGFMERL